MTWGFFSPAHIVSMILAVAQVVALYLILKNKSQKVQLAVLVPLSFSGIATIIYNLVSWGEPLAYLPLHLCSLNAMVLPFAVIRRNKTVCNLLLVWSLGAFIAILLNQDVMDVVIPSWTFFFYYFPHVMELGIPLLLFKLGLVEKDPKCIGSTLAITAGAYTVIHFINVAVNSWCASVGKDLTVNYMFSLDPTNPVLVLFYNLIPYQYWYMYMVFPIVGVYLLIVYAPQILKALKNRKVKTV